MALKLGTWQPKLAGQPSEIETEWHKLEKIRSSLPPKIQAWILAFKLESVQFKVKTSPLKLKRAFSGLGRTVL
jgi:hypothetical protein